MLISKLSIWTSLEQFVPTSELEYLIRVLVGALLGFCIGIERSRRQKEAGMGTHFIVASASALLTCISLWFKKDAGDLGDGARIAAQIVSGIGFLGAGMIFFRRESMRGLTTAAGIWATAAIGMCAATGMFFLAVGTTVIIIIFQILNHSKLLKRDSTHLLLVKLQYNDSIKEKMIKFFGFRNFHRFKITSGSDKVSGSSGGSRNEESKQVFVEAVIRPRQNCSVEAITQFICDNAEVKSIERLEDL
ncbi:MAG: MgtC/SapB family protein [Lachnospiraceae bacterium]|nr:MgtC/SapB family protein [Lachnospiraceae bacterium]